MGHFEALIYGLVQGATEYLPVSSSAHLLVLPHIFGQKDPGLAFDVILHFGTLLATAVYFFKDWVAILKTPMPQPDSEGSLRHLSWVHLIVGTLPAVIVGLLLNHWIQDHTRSLVILWVTLPVFGVLLWWVDRVKPKDRKMSDTTVKDMFIVGCAQTLALIPGVSRSGSTITATRYLGFNRGDAARISFLMSLPVTAGAIVYESRHWREIIESANGMGSLLIALTAALVSGAFAIHYLIKWVSKSNYAVFAAYRVLAGILIAVFLGTGSDS
jgi:undecaprenyl-diphosphatase